MEISYIIVLIVVVTVGYLAWRDTSEAPAPAKKVAKSSQSVIKADANNNGVVSKAELNKLTKVQLFDFAEKNSLKVKK